VAVYNEILAGRFNRFVQKLLSIKGPTSLVAVSPDMRFVIPMRTGVENDYLQDWTLMGFYTAQNAGVGNATSFRLRNPTGSNIIAVVSLAYGYNTTASDTFSMDQGATTADLANVIPISGFGWDGRGKQGSALSFSWGVKAGLTTLFTYQNPTVQPFPYAFNMLFGLQFPLTPGKAIQINNAAANVTTSAAFWWAERPLEDSERT
jgi:hypothetical protein